MDTSYHDCLLIFLSKIFLLLLPTARILGKLQRNKMSIVMMTPIKDTRLIKIAALYKNPLDT